jgi:hypothetical protein
VETKIKIIFAILILGLTIFAVSQLDELSKTIEYTNVANNVNYVGVTGGAIGFGIACGGGFVAIGLLIAGIRRDKTRNDSE